MPRQLPAPYCPGWQSGFSVGLDVGANVSSAVGDVVVGAPVMGDGVGEPVRHTSEPLSLICGTLPPAQHVPSSTVVASPSAQALSPESQPSFGGQLHGPSSKIVGDDVGAALEGGAVGAPLGATVGEELGFGVAPGGRGKHFCRVAFQGAMSSQYRALISASVNSLACTE